MVLVFRENDTYFGKVSLRVGTLLKKIKQFAGVRHELERVVGLSFESCKLACMLFLLLNAIPIFNFFVAQLFKCSEALVSWTVGAFPLLCDLRSDRDAAF